MELIEQQPEGRNEIANSPLEPEVTSATVQASDERPEPVIRDVGKVALPSPATPFNEAVLGPRPTDHRPW